ncbi:DUF2515 family protein [Caldalkalibacillus thermarum TA2.A1]|uniref:DUF2515 family protein n=1 Tax=Caldalkalibacillus thermarum (strain TA2.A1) TaxID=986075 RepID=A0A8X8IAL8_CALTT|nr:DUF2515 family protein [Caldalkalibacillus thermarum TA2.A1]
MILCFALRLIQAEQVNNFFVFLETSNDLVFHDAYPQQHRSTAVSDLNSRPLKQC